MGVQVVTERDEWGELHARALVEQVSAAQCAVNAFRAASTEGLVISYDHAGRMDAGQCCAAEGRRAGRRAQDHGGD